ncbi:MAG: ABC transporter substrate-binding protein [Prolixibacteraceae bacterium]|nr:ABC transporter substrate-binding protein [Prolixibacteraceae bacterium]
MAKISSFVSGIEFMANRLFFFILIAFFIAGCKNTSHNKSSQVSYKIATLKGPSSMGMIRLIDSITNVANPEIEVDILNEPIQVRKMMLNGTADFAILPTTMAAILYNKGVDYQLIAVPVWGTLYLLGQDTSITCWEDLRHKKVNVMAKGMTPDVLFRYLLQKNGIDSEKDITLDYSFPTHIDLANAVAAGQAELGVISEPLVSLVMSKNTNVHPIFDLNLEWSKLQNTPIAMTAFLGKRSVLKEKPQLAEQIISSYIKSTLWVNQYPDSAAKLIVDYGILPEQNVAAQAIPRSNLHFERARNVKKQVENYLDIFYDLNPEIIGGKLPDENFYY